MKYAIRLFPILFFLAGCVGLVRLSFENGRLVEQIDQLEAELGGMSIEDSDRVYMVEIETPDVPPEIASHVERVWQFRCYLPPGYSFMRTSGGGRVAKEGIYSSGGFSTSWSMPAPKAIHSLLTLCTRRKDGRFEAFYSFGGSSGTSSWNRFDPGRLDNTLVVQKLVSSDQGPRSFNQDTILPVLKIYDPSGSETVEVDGETLTTYPGGLILLCPKSRESELHQLRKGETPTEFDPSMVATEAGS
ncbi:hypothetical protein Q31b_34510 [Novipirellula aureliae]|uniref:Lipoprotein n=1 Tax=Novipirellula aureliae TaxID=2527966 RepID=A0A5C6DW01_9BACT|nr:hypothetical protein [Novipirellula aureliae]TWU40107.1 hypothetical protein Q31b_34510 [Novipirellula aureliae]